MIEHAARRFDRGRVDRVLVVVGAHDAEERQRHVDQLFRYAEHFGETDEPLLAVGYGKENSTEYYLLKHNLGTNWGEEGYVRIAINGDGPGVCGIQTNPYFAIAK